jgi:hypothetical protein
LPFGCGRMYEFAIQLVVDGIDTGHRFTQVPAI